MVLLLHGLVDQYLDQQKRVAVGQQSGTLAPGQQHPLSDAGRAETIGAAGGVQVFGDRLKLTCADKLGDEGRDYLERMQNAVGRMHTFINDLLSYSRVTTKAMPFEPVDLGKITGEVLSDLEIRLEQVNGKGGRVKMRGAQSCTFLSVEDENGVELAKAVL